MKQSYLLLSLAALALLATTAVTGLLVQGEAGFARHFLLGLLACMFACFVHIVCFMYFVVQHKIVVQAALQGDVDAAKALPVQAMKSRALRFSMVGIAAVLVTGGLGAAIDGVVIPAEVHLLAAFGAIFVNAVVFFLQFALIDEYSRFFTAVLGE